MYNVRSFLFCPSTVSTLPTTYLFHINNITEGRYLRYLPPCIMSYKLLYHAYVRHAIQTTTPNTTERTERIGFYTNISLYVIHTVWTYYVQIH